MASLVYLKHKNGITYVYENVSFWDRKSKKPKSKRKCIGHLDPETGTVQPNGMRGGNRKNTVQNSEKEPPQCFTYSCGVSSLLDKVCADTGLGHMLKKVFPDDWDAILTCAYYLVSEGQALYRTENQEVNKRYNTPQYIVQNNDNNHNILNKNTDKIRLLSPRKNIWLYTGYTWEEIMDYKTPFDNVMAAHNSEILYDYQMFKRQQIISQCNVMVDGRYIDAQRDITLPWVGSSNQRVIDIQQSLQRGEIVLWK